MFPIVMLVLNVSSVAVLWFGAFRVEAGDDAGRLADRVPQLPHADPHGRDDGDLHGRACCRAPRSAPTGSARCSTPSRRCAAPDDAGHRRSTRRAASSFDGVTFSYPGAEQPVLRDVTFTAQPGQTTAIIGCTGAGKTTLVNLLPRLFDATGGAVLVDGVDVRELDPDLLWSRIGTRAAEARTCSRAPSRSTCATASPMPPTTSSGRRSRSRRRATSSRRCPSGSTRRSRRAAPTCPAASGSGSRSPGRSSSGRRSTSSTTRSRRSTLATDARLRAALARDVADATHDHRRPAGVDHPQRRPDHRARGRRVVGRGTHDELLETSPTYAEIVESSSPRRRQHERRPNRARERQPPVRARRGPMGRRPVRRDAGMPAEKSMNFGRRRSDCSAGCSPSGSARARVIVLASSASCSACIGPKILGEATNIIFEGAISAQPARRGHAGAGHRPASSRGQNHQADMLRDMNLTPGQGIDFAALALVLVLVLALYVLASLFSWLQGYVLNGVIQRTMLPAARATSRTKINRLPLQLLRQDAARRTAQPGDQRHRQRLAEPAADAEPAAHLAADGHRRRWS